MNAGGKPASRISLGRRETNRTVAPKGTPLSEILTPSVVEALAHLTRRHQTTECCGWILLGKVYSSPNPHPRPERGFMLSAPPSNYVDAHHWHSHLKGRAVPSAQDVQLLLHFPDHDCVIVSLPEQRICRYTNRDKLGQSFPCVEEVTFF